MCECIKTAPNLKAHVMTFDNLPFLFVWDNLVQSYSLRKFEFESGGKPNLLAVSRSVKTL